MKSSDYVKRRIALLRPRAKFPAYGHSSDFADATLGVSFHTVNLYDEQIDSNVIVTPHGLILIENTYLSSFAYNLLLVWLSNTANPQPIVLTTLLKHNFKKFFAEQLLHARNNIFARAILLETLLYEQISMVPVFAAKSQDQALDKAANVAARMMSSLISSHELGHIMLKRLPAEWDSILNLHSRELGDLVERVAITYPPAFVEEFKCDAMAVISTVSLYEPETNRLFCLRTIAFAYAAYAVLSSLTKSAKQTATDQKNVPDTVDLGSIQKQHRDYDYTIGQDLDLIERARLMIELCDRLAQSQEQSLFGTAQDFPLPPSILEDLLSYLDQIMLNDDPNARDMSLLVAEALQGHPQGMHFLYLRSKTFSGRSDAASGRAIMEWM